MICIRYHNNKSDIDIDIICNSQYSLLYLTFIPVSSTAAKKIVHYELYVVNILA